MPTTRSLVALFAGSFVLTGCADSPDSLRSEIVERHAVRTYEAYGAALRDAQRMSEAIDRFLLEPTEASFEEARQGWLDARESYGPTEVHRFYGGPIDDDRGLEPLINAWPLDESYIDYVVGAPDAGIIQMTDEFPEIDSALLQSLNELGGETNISTGFHAIEFLLWGQDLDPEGPGARPFTDYVPGVGRNADRRADYLRSATLLLIENLSTVHADWAPDTPGNFRDRWTQGDPDEALARILLGMGSLAQAELAGERMEVALANGDQEDEHSCFSDNTHRDLVLNAVGIRNVYLDSFHELLTRTDASLAEEVGGALEEAIDALEALPTPFDRAISFDHPESRERVSDAIELLHEVTDRLTRAGAELELDLSGMSG